MFILPSLAKLVMACVQLCSTICETLVMSREFLLYSDRVLANSTVKELARRKVKHNYAGKQACMMARTYFTLFYYFKAIFHLQLIKGFRNCWN